MVDITTRAKPARSSRLVRVVPHLAPVFTTPDATVLEHVEGLRSKWASRGRPPSTRAPWACSSRLRRTKSPSRPRLARGSPRARAANVLIPGRAFPETAPTRSGTRAAPAPAGRPRRPPRSRPVHHARRREGDDVLDLVAEHAPAAPSASPSRASRRPLRVYARPPGRCARFRAPCRSSLAAAARCALPKNTSMPRASAARRERLLHEHVVVAQIAHQALAQLARGNKRAGLELPVFRAATSAARNTLAVAQCRGVSTTGRVPKRSVTGGSPTRRLSRRPSSTYVNTRVRGVRVVQRHHSSPRTSRARRCNA